MNSPTKILAPVLLTVNPSLKLQLKHNILRMVFPDESFLGTRSPLYLIHILISYFCYFLHGPYYWENILFSSIISSLLSIIIH